jgi:hypothetical protein
MEAAVRCFVKVERRVKVKTNLGVVSVVIEDEDNSPIALGDI